MKHLVPVLFTIIILFSALQSNGQKYKIGTRDLRPDVKRSFLMDTSAFFDTSKSNMYIMNYKPLHVRFYNSSKMYAYLPSNSDTLMIQDTVWVLYDHLIRYIKIGNKVYPLNPKQP